MSEKWKKLVDPNELIIDPIEKAYTLPSAWYTVLGIFKRLWEKVFLRI